MACHKLYQKGHFMVVNSFWRKGKYYTVVNTKRNTHCHVDKNNFTAARVICYRAYKGEIPAEYPDWMKTCIRRIIDE